MADGRSASSCRSGGAPATADGGSGPGAPGPGPRRASGDYRGTRGRGVRGDRDHALPHPHYGQPDPSDHAPRLGATPIRAAARAVLTPRRAGPRPRDGTGPALSPPGHNGAGPVSPARPARAARRLQPPQARKERQHGSAASRTGARRDRGCARGRTSLPGGSQSPAAGCGIHPPHGAERPRARHHPPERSTHGGERIACTAAGVTATTPSPLPPYP